MAGLFRVSSTKVKPGPSHLELPPLTEVITREIRAFEDWMRNKRYSESTIKTYRESIGIFFRYLRSKRLEEIDNEDFEKSNKEYIIERVIPPPSKTRWLMR